jgi:hypothetical protein
MPVTPDVKEQNLCGLSEKKPKVKQGYSDNIVSLSFMRSATTAFPTVTPASIGEGVIAKLNSSLVSNKHKLTIKKASFVLLRGS